MIRTSQPTAYARLSPRLAQAALAALVLACGVLTFCLPHPLWTWERHHDSKKAAKRAQNAKVDDDDGKKTGDIALYQAEVDRIHKGEGYYEAAAAELPQRGYPTRSVFNWRTPLPMWLIGILPKAVMGKVLLGVLAVGLLLMIFEGLAREEDNAIRRPALCVLLLVGPLMPCLLGNLYMMPMVWAGFFIAASIAAYGVDRPYLGVALGIAAVFFRDLALPYCLLGAAFALWNRRHGELAAWTLGLTAWGIFFALHWMKVKTLILPGARGHSEGWLQFGGIPFLVQTTQMNAWLMVLPQFITALFLAMALFGFLGWHTRLGLRAGLTAFMFLAAFSMVGQSFNVYWGSLLAPLLCFGVARFPGSLQDAIHAAELRSVRGA